MKVDLFNPEVKNMLFDKDITTSNFTRTYGSIPHWSHLGAMQCDENI
jgi:hypothetical protein